MNKSRVGTDSLLAKRDDNMCQHKNQSFKAGLSLEVIVHIAFSCSCRRASALTEVTFTYMFVTITIPVHMLAAFLPSTRLLTRFKRQKK